MIARAQFYMAVRYDGAEASTVDLELTNGDPANPSGETDPPPQMGDLASMIAWHFAAPPDSFERGRHQIVYDDYQENRNPFIDRPEYTWSVFVDQVNDSQITIAGGTTDANGASTRNVDLGRVFVGGAVPAAQNFTLSKGGLDGTYYEVTAAGEATSSIGGRYNAFLTNTTDSESISVGLNTTMATAGLKSGTVTVDNLDVTNQFGAGHASLDGNDTFSVGLAVVDHATPSFDGFSEAPSLVYDFGSVLQGSLDPNYSFDVFNLEETLGFTAELDFDSFLASGDTTAFLTDFAAAAGSLSIVGGASSALNVAFDTSSLGSYSATYNLSFSDEDLPGALASGLSLTVTGQVVAAAVPEPASWVLLATAACLLGLRRRKR